MPEANGSKATAKTPSADADSIRLPKHIRAVKNSEKAESKGRTIVVCLDGTGDKFDDDNSNIVQIVKCLKKDDKSQVTYYQTGIGTYSEGGLSAGFSAALDMAVGSGLGLHVRDAYHFLMHTYKEKDKICIFGFSRGAYTARCLAGMIHKVGLLPPRNVEQIPFAYEFYKDDTPLGWRHSLDFKKTFCIDVSVYFLGVFDSVASVGIIPRQLPLSSTPFNKSHYFRHAVALDERRAKFKPCHYQALDWKDIEERHLTDVMDVTKDAFKNAMTHEEEYMSDSDYEQEKGHPKPFNTDVKEVWFLGCHADVGGGAVKNWERHKLANISLRWMLRQCFECKTGILFSTKHLAECGLDVHRLWPKYQKPEVPENFDQPPDYIMERYKAGLPPMHHRSKRLIPVEEAVKEDGKKKKEGHYDFHLHDEEEHKKTGVWLPEQIEDYFDGLQKSNDQLEVAKGWWILEYWPVDYYVQRTETDDWDKVNGMNKGRYRAMMEKEPKIHWTVAHRMQNEGYKIQARYGRNCKWQYVAS